MDSLLSREGWTRADGVRRALDDASSSARLRRQLWYLWVLEEWLRSERAGEPNDAAVAVPLSAPR